MAQMINLKPSGLYNNPNQYSSIPDGSLVTATNCVIDRPGLIDCRRGNKLYSTDCTDVSRLFRYKNRLIALYDTDTLAYDDGAGAFTPYSGTYVQPDTDYKMRGVQSNSNFYFTTSQGIYKLNSIAGTPAVAGISPGLDLSAAIDGVAGFLDHNHGVAYRILWGIKDENNNLLLGAPSQRALVYNTSGGQRDISLTFTIPDQITTNYFYQIYRSYSVSPTTAVPTDELYLVYEGNPSSAQITAGVVTIVDNTPFELMGEALYTNATQQGIAQGNYQPPYCKDMDIYQNTLFLANTKQRHNYNTTLIGIGSPDGIQADDTITIGGITFTAKATENIASNHFEVFTGGTLAENIENTAQSLVRVINRSTTATVYAYYQSGFNELPGKIRFEEKTVGGSAFAVTSSRGTAFTPELPTSGTSQSSSAEVRQNGLYFSKSNQPESVPYVNYLLIGSADVAIDRIVALRDSLFIFKKDGIFRLTGSDAQSFSVVLFDNTTSLIAKESAVPFNNSVMGWFDQGICSVSDGGVAIVSEPIAQELLILSSSNYPNFDKATFGISYETDRKYIVYTNTATNDTVGTQALVYNSQTNAWVRWVNTRTCGIIGSDSKLYAGGAIGIYQERKAFDNYDYADESYDVTIVSTDGLDVELNDVANVVVGMTLKQGDAYSIITAITGSIVTVSDNIAWDLDPAEVYTPISVEIQFSPIHCGEPARVKYYQEIVYSFNNGLFDSFTGFFTSDFCDEEQTLPIEGGGRSGWGLFEWENVPWGIDTSKIKNFRTYIPMEASKAHHLNIGIRFEEAFVNPMIMGITLQFAFITFKYQG